MPESSFSSTNQIQEIESRAGRFFTQRLLRRLVARDVELMDLMDRGGPPSSTPVLSAVQLQTDIVISTSTTLGGIVYCDTFTVNPGVTLRVDRALMIVARKSFTGHGWINADGVNNPSYGACIPGGGGAGGQSGAGVEGSPGLLWATGGVAGGVGANGGAGPALTANLKGIIIESAWAMSPQCLGGARGGQGGQDSNQGGAGGFGGGLVIIDAPSIIISSSGAITARGAAGTATRPDGGGIGYYSGGAGGGGGGIILGRTRSWTNNGNVSVVGGNGYTTGWGRTGGKGTDGVAQIDIYG